MINVFFNNCILQIFLTYTWLLISISSKKSYNIFFNISIRCHIILVEKKRLQLFYLCLIPRRESRVSCETFAKVLSSTLFLLYWLMIKFCQFSILRIQTIVCKTVEKVVVLQLTNTTRGLFWIYAFCHFLSLFLSIYVGQM